jgi:quinol monooxygenase YgiN
MIIVVGTVEVAESDRGRYLESRRDQVAHTLDETGCIDYSFAADATHPDRVRLLERWETLADLQAHVAALRAAAPTTEPVVSSKYTEVSVYEATPVDGAL